jgi:hypothetical protein
MTVAALTAVSILAIAGLAWFASRALRLPLCPICIGVVGTWLWMLGARFAGLPIDGAMLGILLGASVVGIANQIEPHLAPRRSRLLWKTLALPIGIAAAYGVAAQAWTLAALAALALAFLAAWFVLPGSRVRNGEPVVKELEEQMKRCC